MSAHEPTICLTPSFRSRILTTPSLSGMCRHPLPSAARDLTPVLLGVVESGQGTPCIDLGVVIVPHSPPPNTTCTSISSTRFSSFRRFRSLRRVHPDAVAGCSEQRAPKRVPHPDAGDDLAAGKQGDRHRVPEPLQLLSLVGPGGERERPRPGLQVQVRGMGGPGCRSRESVLSCDRWCAYGYRSLHPGRLDRGLRCLNTCVEEE